MRHWLSLSIVTAALAFGCGDDSEPSPRQPEEKAAAEMHELLLGNVIALNEAAKDIQRAAPEVRWDAEQHETALTEMVDAWLEARREYERIEGAIAPLYAEIDAAIDARYEDFLEGLGTTGDTNLFDAEGVTGMHAIERILFAKETPEAVVQLEASLPGYAPAAWPASDEEALAFKNELCGQLVKDTQRLLDEWSPQDIAVDGAFAGLMALMNEQREKVNKASTQEEESRYAQRTMADLRDNLAGTRRAYGVFRSWILSKPGGAEVDAKIQAGFAELETTYDSVAGDAFPRAPETWSAEEPSEEDLATPFGQLYQAVHEAVDPNRPDSLVSSMNDALVLLGFEELTEE